MSAHVHRDDGFHDHALTFLFVAWGQFTDHDITLTSEIDEVVEEDLNCCSGKARSVCSQSLFNFTLISVRTQRDPPDVFSNRGQFHHDTSLAPTIAAS